MVIISGVPIFLIFTVLFNDRVSFGTFALNDLTYVLKAICDKATALVYTREVFPYTLC